MSLVCNRHKKHWSFDALKKSVHFYKTLKGLCTGVVVCKFLHVLFFFLLKVPNGFPRRPLKFNSVVSVYAVFSSTVTYSPLHRTVIWSNSTVNQQLQNTAAGTVSRTATSSYQRTVVCDRCLRTASSYLFGKEK